MHACMQRRAARLLVRPHLLLRPFLIWQALKVAQKNEALLKKKSDMLELTVMSHQKSMDKGKQASLST